MQKELEASRERQKQAFIQAQAKKTQRPLRADSDESYEEFTASETMRRRLGSHPSQIKTTKNQI